MGDYIVVKWLSTLKWDVYPIRNLRDKELQVKLVDDKRYWQQIKTNEVEVEWKEGCYAPAYVLGVGSARAMEKKRTSLSSESPIDIEQKENRSCEPCGALKERVADLESELDAAKKKAKKYKAARNEARQMLDVAALVSELTGAVQAARSTQADVATPEAQVDIGNGVTVSQQLIDRIRHSAGKQATKFARNLVRAVFTAEELEGSSMYGRVCNARKDDPPKKALDRVKLDSVISYTCSLYGVPARVVTGTISTMLARGHK